MSKLKFAVHEIHDKNGVHHLEVFEPVAEDVEFLESTGAVREPTEQELAFYHLTNSTPDPVEREAKLAAAKPARAKKADAVDEDPIG